MHSNTLTGAVVCLVLLGSSLTARGADPQASYLYPQQAGKVETFISEQRLLHNRDPKQLRRLFSYVKINHKLFPQVKKPVEVKITWESYRNLFISDQRATEAAEFCRTHAAVLSSVQEIYQVEPSLVCAIIAVETYLGKNTGAYPVFITLSNLAFQGTRRTGFFRRELGHFIALSEHEKLDTISTKGSYAGAMGLPQFISSSYLRIAVDYDCDGVRNLWNSVSDAVGSVGSYFQLSGWKLNQPTLIPLASGRDTKRFSLGAERELTKVPLSRLAQANLDLPRGTTLPSKKGTAVLFYVIGKNGAKQYFVGLPNFLAILKYNGATFYGMVVSILAERIGKKLQ